MLLALDAGAEDVRESAGLFEVISAASDFGRVKSAFGEAGLGLETAEVTQLPSTTVPVDERTAPKVLRLIDALEDLDDVQNVYSNFDIADDVMAELAAGG